MNPRILMSLIPVAVFLLLSRVAPPWVSISGGFAASTLVFFFNRKDKLIGALTLFGFVVVAISAIIGLIWSSEKAYLASGPISDFLFVPLYLLSIRFGKPLVGGIARELVPAVAGKVPIDARVYVHLSYMWAGYDFLHGIARAYLLNTMDVTEYVIMSKLLAWPVNAALLGITMYFIYREAKRRDDVLVLAAQPVQA